MSGALLAAGAGVVAAAAIAHYATTVRAVRVALRPRAHQAALLVAAALAVAALASGAGWIGGAVSALVLVVAGAFLFLTSQSTLPAGRLAVTTGGPALDFATQDSEGNAFSLGELRGQRILLKFFRGHW